jgi:hypothetical protein
MKTQRLAPACAEGTYGGLAPAAAPCAPAGGTDDDATAVVAPAGAAGAGLGLVGGLGMGLLGRGAAANLLAPALCHNDVIFRPGHMS